MGLELLENAFATSTALAAIILMFAPVSGAHFNPVVTLADTLLGRMSWRGAATYGGAQIGGAAVGAILANLMFSLPAVELSTKVRAGAGLWLAEVIATYGLVLLIFSLVRTGRAALAPFAVAAWIAGAYWFTASTSFANPAVAVARELSNTFAGIAPSSVPAFVLAQVLGAVAAVATVRVLFAESTALSEGDAEWISGAG